MKARLWFSICVLVFSAQPALGQWAPNGIAVSADSSNQEYCHIISDGSGGAIVMWLDDRNASPCIYAQRLDPDGFRLWNSVGISVGDTTSTLGPSLDDLIPDGFGGAIIAWVISTCYKCENIYAERINGAGQSLWSRSGIPVCTATGPQVNARIASDGAGGAVIAWEDGRTGSGQTTYAQRLNASGTPLWATNGILVCSSTGNQRMQQIASDGAGGAIITWADSRSGYWDIYAQRVSSSGVLLWASTGVAVCAASGNQTFPQIVSDGANGAIIAWEDNRGSNTDIYAQRIDGNGTPLWIADGVAVCSAANTQTDVVLTPDGEGGAVIAWPDARSGAYDVYAQRVTADGLALWAADGIALCTAPGQQTWIQIASDLAGGAVVSWIDGRGADPDVYAQRVDANGSVRWAADGAPVCVMAEYQYHPYIATDGAGGAIITWYGWTGSLYEVRAQRAYADSGPVATLLQNWSIRGAKEGIEIEWTLSDAGREMRFFVLRADSPDERFREIPRLIVEREGMDFRVLDGTVLPGKAYAYRIDVDDEQGRRTLFETDAVEIPEARVTLYQNFPNPFNPVTTIKCYVPEKDLVVLEVYAVSGRRITVLLNEVKDAGTHVTEWDGKDGQGKPVASGVYFCRLTAGKETISRKMVLLR